jgi:nitrogen regulatory protein PII
MIMKTYTKKRIAIVIEQPALNRVLDALDKLEATGYTVYPVIAGHGREGSWRADGQVSDAGRMVSVVCVCDPTRVDAIIEPIFAIVSRHVGIITISDCEVIRPDHF